MKLDTLRREIDKINADIIDLLAVRLNVTAQVAKEKKKSALPIHDEKREMEQYEELRKLAIEKRLSPQIVEEIFKIFIEYSKLKMKLETEA